jgi:hypothetical protein
MPISFEGLPPYEKLYARSVKAEASQEEDCVVLTLDTWIEDYVHPTPLIPVCAPPTDADVQRDVLFAWHAMSLYVSATPAIPIT